jgi:hypothetical protein
MCIRFVRISHANNHQTIWIKKMCMDGVSSDAVHLLISTVQCNIATLLLLSSAWVRYAGTTRSLSKGGAYAFIITAQVGKATLPPVFVLYFR